MFCSGGIYIINEIFRRSLMDQERISTGPFLCDDILWVLTVPAAWTDSAKQLMRESARNVGFSNTYLHHNATKFQTQ